MRWWKLVTGCEGLGKASAKKMKQQKGRRGLGCHAKEIYPTGSEEPLTGLSREITLSDLYFRKVTQVTRWRQPGEGSGKSKKALRNSLDPSLHKGGTALRFRGCPSALHQMAEYLHITYAHSHIYFKSPQIFYNT